MEYSQLFPLFQVQICRCGESTSNYKLFWIGHTSYPFMASLAFGTRHVSSQQMQEKMTFLHLRHWATEKSWWQFFSGTIFFRRREVHFKLNYDLWKVLETCLTAPRSIVCTTPLQNPFEGISGREDAPGSWVRLPALATGIHNHGINLRSQRGQSQGRAWRDSIKATAVSKAEPGGISVHQRHHLSQCTYGFKNKPTPFLLQEPQFLIIGVWAGQ